MLVAVMPAPSLQGVSADETLVLGTNSALHLDAVILRQTFTADQCFGQGIQGQTCCFSTEEAYFFIQDISIIEFVLNQGSD